MDKLVLGIYYLLKYNLKLAVVKTLCLTVIFWIHCGDVKSQNDENCVTGQLWIQLRTKSLCTVGSPTLNSNVNVHSIILNLCTYSVSTEQVKHLWLYLSSVWTLWVSGVHDDRCSKSINTWSWFSQDLTMKHFITRWQLQGVVLASGFKWLLWLQVHTLHSEDLVDYGE